MTRGRWDNCIIGASVRHGQRAERQHRIPPSPCLHPPPHRCPRRPARGQRRTTTSCIHSRRRFARGGSPPWSSSGADPLYVHQAVRRRSVRRRRSASPYAGLARVPLTSAPATRLAERAPVGYITPIICPLERCTMIANDAPHWFPDHREGERRLLPSRRSGLDRRYQSMPPTVERRGAGERDRKSVV